MSASAEQGALAPKSSPRSNPHAHAGRKLVGGASTGGKLHDNGGSPKTTEKKPKRGAQTMEELDRRVEADALALINMKREIIEAQRLEIVKSQKTCMELKKEHDALFIATNMKERELAGILDKVKTLQVVDRDVKAASNETHEMCRVLQAQIDQTEENMAAEQRTMKMQIVMANRLEAEISECRIESGTTLHRLEQIKHELAGTEATLVLSRQELGDREQKIAQMKTSTVAREKDRKGRIKMMESIIEAGESSYAKLQSMTMESAKNSPNNKRKGHGTMNSTGYATKRALADDAENAEPFDPSLDIESPQKQAKRLTVQQVRDLVDRYNTRESRLEKLEKLESDLKDGVAAQKAKKLDVTQTLEETAAKLKLLASSRQVYQEVDLKDANLASARKECDECRDRDYRLRVNLESLKRSIPRFLTKLTKTPHPVPGLDELAEVVQKLEDEILKLFKEISTAMLKEATPADLLAMQSQSQVGGTAETSSEIARLQKLPGFSRLQKQLYVNMMGAKVDVSMQNVRVIANEARKAADLGLTSNRKNAYDTTNGHSRRFASSSASVDTVDPNDDEGSPGAAPGEAITNKSSSLDRETIKKISKLVIERDGKGKAPPTAREVVVKKAAYKPKFVNIA